MEDIGMTTDQPAPDLVLDLIESFRRSKIMFAAVELGLFDALAEGPARAEELAVCLGVHASSLRRLLDACTALGLVVAEDTRYRLKPATETFLTKNGKMSLVGYVQYSNNALWYLWGRLEQAVREGTHRWEAAFGGKGELFSHYYRTDESKRTFLMGMHGYGLLSSPGVVAAFDLGCFKRLVDLGGGTGHLAIEACRRYPSLRAAVLDLPEVVPLTREVIAASGLGDRIEVIAGDFFRDEIPEADLYALGRIVHDWGDEKIDALLAKIVASLPAGGGLLVAETLLDEDGPGPRWARMQDLNMLCVTEGRERTLAEYEALMRRAGFTRVAGRRIGAPLDAVLALRD
jgi:acetylserotonin N-methyltransferase